MSDLQWQKGRCVEWMMDRWLQCVPGERTKQWQARLGMRLTEDQFQETCAALEKVRDEDLSRWLLDEAEPWQQSLLWSTFWQTCQGIEAVTAPDDPLIVAIALHMRDEDSLGTILRLMMESRREGR